MTLRRLLLLALFAALAAPAGQAQELVLRGGPSLLANPSDPNAETGGTSAFASLGGRFWLSDLFQFEANVAYDQRFSLEGLVHVRPFARPMPLAPYFFLGVGAQFEGEDRRGVVPVGIGLEYDVSPSTGVFFELAGRWQSRKNPQANVDELDFFVTPTVGLAYRFGTRPPFIARGDRDDFRPEEEPLLTAAEQPAEQPAEPAAESAGSAVVTPASAQFPQASYPGPASVAPVAQRPSAPPQGEPAVMGWSNNAWLIAPVEDHGDRVRVPDGTFIMGLMDEDPLRLQTANLKRVTVSSFFVDKQEVTVGKYRGYLETLDPSQRGELMPDAAAWERSGSRTTFQQYFQSGAFDDHPVLAVTWDQAQAFCTAQGGRLPTEAEWEYAARSGQPGGIYPWPGFDVRGPSGGYLANYSPGRGIYAADGYAFTSPVSAFPATAWGLHDVAGNAAEWVADNYVASFGAMTNFNPLYESEEEERHVVRGGSWASDEFYIGVGVRDAQPATEATIYTGFRCAYDVGAVQPGTTEVEADVTGAEGDRPGLIIADDPTGDGQ